MISHRISHRFYVKIIPAHSNMLLLLVPAQLLTPAHALAHDPKAVVRHYYLTADFTTIEGDPSKRFSGILYIRLNISVLHPFCFQ